MSTPIQTAETRNFRTLIKTRIKRSKGDSSGESFAGIHPPKRPNRTELRLIIADVACSVCSGAFGARDLLAPGQVMIGLDSLPNGSYLDWHFRMTESQARNPCRQNAMDSWKLRYGLRS